MARRAGVIGIVQMRSVLDKDVNFALARRLVQEAAARQADLVCLPENFDYIGVGGEPEPLTGPTVLRYQALSRELKVWISLGGMHEHVADKTPSLANTHVIIDAQGVVRACYRKVHLFDANVDGGWHESKSTVAGDELVVLKDTPLGVLGLATCFDVRFPEHCAALKAAGANVVLVPSAFMPTTGAAHWHVLLRARAIENQVFVAAAAQWGAHSPARSSFGHGLLVGPWGEVIEDLGATGDGVAVARLDLRAIDDAANRIDVAQSRRRAQSALAKPVSVL